jgi:hypothetical protein
MDGCFITHADRTLPAVTVALFFIGVAGLRPEEN